MTVPGVNLICAASFIAAVGDTSRFLTSRKLVAYLGLDPKVRQSGEDPPARPDQQARLPRRRALVEAAWSVVLQPGPLHAFYQRTRARRGHGKAIVATARKLAVLFWCMLTRREDYAHQQPSLTNKKLRRLELTAGAPNAIRAAGSWATNDVRQAERESPAKPRPPTSARSKTGRRTGREGGREHDTGARIKEAPRNKSRAADHKPRTLRFDTSSPAPTRPRSHSSPRGRQHHLTFSVTESSGPGGGVRRGR